MESIVAAAAMVADAENSGVGGLLFVASCAALAAAVVGIALGGALGGLALGVAAAVRKRLFRRAPPSASA